MGGTLIKMLSTFGGACTKALAKNTCNIFVGRFDSVRLHNRVMVYTEKLYSLIQSEGWKGVRHKVSMVISHTACGGGWFDSSCVC